MTKRLSGEENALTFQVWTGLSAMTALGAALGLAALYEAPGAAPVWPSADQALGLFALGVSARWPIC